ncbi:hypothetical protein FB645_005653 [Coemansia sp. IMI 203386]|nr:hypothetical protein FB645_005653 [Coemansia sp. IMI 203386]
MHPASSKRKHDVLMMPPPEQPHPFTTRLPHQQQQRILFSNELQVSRLATKRRRTRRQGIEIPDTADTCKLASKRKGSHMDVVELTKRPKNDDGQSTDESKSDDEEADVLPKLRVIDLPLSIRAGAFLQDGPKRSSGQGIRDAGCNALVLYKPPEVVKAKDDDVFKQSEQQKDRIGSPSMDVD